MESKVISTRVSLEMFDRVNAVADRLYPKSYTGQPNRTQLLMDAINLFCDLGEAGSLDGMNLSQVNTAEIIYSAQQPKQKILEDIRNSLQRVEAQLSGDRDSFVYSVNEKNEHQQNFSLSQAWQYASANGYASSKDTFRKQFSKHTTDKNYSFQGFTRIANPKGRGYLYQLATDNHE